MLVRLELVSVPADENVDVELSLDECESIGTSPGYDLVSMAQADAELTDRHYFLLWVVEILQRNEIVFVTSGRKKFPPISWPHIIEIASNDMNVARQALQVVVGLLCTEISGHENVVNSPGHQQLLKLVGN